MTFDPTKPCTTRDGREVRLFTERMKNGRLVGTVTERMKNGRLVGTVTEGDREAVHTWWPSGRFGRDLELNLDLINIPAKRTVWMNFYANGSCSKHDSREDADKLATCMLYTHRIACVKVEFEEGEGL